MELSPILLSRIQFAWVVGWHILLPAFTVGIASFIALAEGLHFFTGRELYLRISTFWIKIFSVSFGMGVVTGIIMPFQFGTNWSRFADATANVLSPLPCVGAGPHCRRAGGRGTLQLFFGDDVGLNIPAHPGESHLHIGRP